ncbi:right-handed parallel beta-helix repeat-containing protein [Pseudopedobacter beijingensis]|uniref:Right-handed parallel beta-helix repeat-containing protein n=1 Tax=Pseudopedobacter beijingensis TaxID=1207056 RepID=A0ABW4IG04_9SPHI
MNIYKAKAILFVLTFLSFSALSKEGTLYVNNLIGNDKFNGLSQSVNGDTGPLKSIQKALDLVKSSGRIEIINTGTPYLAGNKVKTGGTYDAPLIIEGNGSEINGLGIINPKEWKLIDNRIYSRSFWPMSNSLKSNKNYDYWIGIPTVWWINGKPGINCKTKTELENTPEGFWWNKAEKTVWFHLPENKTFESMEIKMPQSGISAGTGLNIGGTIKNVIIQNLRSRYSFNDGFSAHGEVENITFRNCISTDNCGQGFSMHGNTKVLIEDSYAARNASSGTCDVNNCEVTYKRCVFRDNSFETGIYTTETVKAVYEDCIISNNHPFEQIWQRGQSTMLLKNCIITGFDQSKSLAMIDKGAIKFENCTLINGASVGRSKNKDNTLTLNNCLLINLNAISPTTHYTISNSETDNKILVNSDGLKQVQLNSRKTTFPTIKNKGAKLPLSVLKMYEMNY